jgi:hypothetical protein
MTLSIDFANDSGSSVIWRIKEKRKNVDPEGER